MTLPDLLDEFNVVIDTAEGLTELRSLILGLAVRGKLVPQDPNDEPASELLKKIEAEKERLYEEDEIREVLKLDKVDGFNVPFQIPNNWIWTKIGTFSYLEMGQSPSSDTYNEVGEGLPFYQGKTDFGDIYPTPTTWCSKPNKISLPGDILISVRAPVGPTNICEEKSCIGRGVAAIRPIAETKTHLILYFMRAFEERIKEDQTGSTFKAINKKNLSNFYFPVPPLAEQHRIVQKIKSLFAEVDELEEKLNRQTKLDGKLQLAVNAEVQQAPDAEASKSAWNFITTNFDTLCHTPEAIDNLKKNILNEAVRGRLVPQNPDDEPASELLKKIEAEKQRLYDEGEIRKPKKLPPVKEDEIPFEIPESWEWTRFEDSINELKGGFAYKSGKMIENSDNQVIRLGNVKNEGLQLDRNPAFISNDYASKTEDYRLEENDILITMTGTREKRDYCFTAVVRNEDLEGRKLYLNQRVGLFKLSMFTDVELYNHFLKSDSLLEALFESATGTANQANISMKSISNLPFPVPPLEEQHRIVQRIEELFAICDRFKAQLEQRRSVNEQLVKGLVQEVLEKADSSEKESIQENEVSIAAESENKYQTLRKAELPLLGPEEDRYFLKRKMLACYIINQSLEDDNFGDTKFEKLLHLADYWAVQRNLKQRYYQKAAGPYDNTFTNTFFKQVTNAKWYKKIRKGNLNRIVAGEKHSRATNYYDFFSEEEFQKVDQLIQYFRKYTYEQPEIISTLYAVWNNRIIRKQPVNDVVLKQDFLDWDEKKAKYKDRLDGALDWMRKVGMIPNGWGKLIKQPKSRA